MSITINEAMKLETFKEFKVIAGRTGLNNKIKKVGILDYEIKEMIEKNFEEDEFVISTLLIVKDQVEALYKIVEMLILAGVSGLAIKNIYFNHLPDEVIELANRKSFPIFIFSNVYFENVITSVVDAIKEKNERKALGIKIDTILYNHLNKTMIKNIAYEINREFKEKNMVIFCKRKNHEEAMIIGNSLNIDNDTYFNKYNKIIPYKEGYLVINTFEDIKKDEVTKLILKRLENLGFYSKQYVIGISSLYEKLEDLKFSINESLYAFKYATLYEKDISFFYKLGTSKIILPLIDNPWIQKYHAEIISPLLIYDRENDTELLKTSIKYIENNGSIKATAKELFQHSNTIRYRITKINKILSENYHIKDFYEELAMAIRIHNLMNLPL